MPIQDFWENSDPTMFWAYRTSFILRQKERGEYDNYISWLSGLYIHNAINSNLYNYFARKTNEEPMEYVKEPFDITGEKQKKRDLEMEKKVALENKIKAMLTNTRAKINQTKK